MKLLKVPVSVVDDTVNVLPEITFFSSKIAVAWKVTASLLFLPTIAFASENSYENCEVNVPNSSPSFSITSPSINLPYT